MVIVYLRQYHNSYKFMTLMDIFLCVAMVLTDDLGNFSHDSLKSSLFRHIFADVSLNFSYSCT